MTQMYNNTFLKAMQHGIRSLLPEWRFPSESEVELINISENATFIASAPNGGGKIILRVHRPDYHTKQEIESELLWIDSLKYESVVTTASPLLLTSGSKIAVFHHDGFDRYVVAFEYLPGNEPAPATDLRADFYALGSITAKLHTHTKNWPIPIGFKRKVWDFESMLGSKPLWGDWRMALGLDKRGRNILEETASRLQRELEEYGKGKDRFGLIHADLRLANLLIEGDNLSVIDFDDCGYSWFMYDFAAAISFMEEDEQIPDLQNSWVNGYRSEAHLSAEDEAALPMFIVLRRMLLTAWIASHSETETAQEMGEAYTEGTIRIAKKYLNS